MTVLEWLKASTRYNFEETTFQRIALDREITESDSATTLTVRDKELFMADIIFESLIASPSSTASQSSSHNGFQQTIGTEQVTDAKRNFDMEMMKNIYLKYDDPRYNLIDGGKKKITFPKIIDVI
jgi:hypothetical protein